MNDLGTALRELARDASPVVATDPAALWTQGRQRVGRQRMIGAGVAAALALAIALAGVLVPRPAVVMPAGQPHDPAIPQNIYTPSRWLGGTGDDGPIGPLAAIGAASRDDTPDIFGISATTGVYRFLDLPGRASGTAVALSPDGRYVAYWLTGRTRGTPYVDLDSEVVVTGFAYYDTTDGSVRRAPQGSEHGLDGRQLYWADSTRLIASYGLRRTKNLISGNLTWAWGPGRTEPASTRGTPADLSGAPDNPDGTYLRRVGSNQRIQVLRRSGSSYAVERRLQLPPDLTEVTPMSTVSVLGMTLSGDELAIVADSTAPFSAPLYLGRVGRNDAIGPFRRVGEFQEVQVLGWRNASTLLFQAQDPSWRGGYAIFEVDVTTGTSNRLGTLGDRVASGYPALSVARDLLSAPMVHGLRPPDPMDPRLRSAGIAAGALLTGGIVLLVVRRRRRRA